MTVCNAADVPPIYVALATHLVSPGDTFDTQGTLNIDGLVLGGREFLFEDGLHYDIALTHAGEGILAAGTVRGHVNTTCDRCLGDAQFDLAAEVTCYYVHELPSEDEMDDDQDFGLIDEVNGRIDLSEAVVGAVYMELPYIVLCDEDCKGLCPVCGCNLNEETCSCSQKAEEAKKEASPFAVLNSLKL
ncbi:MAG: DUF177 domain-containing protein [Coriobacteriales bacterium]|nr:DUF177 domain-containing protein [Coriobacteriales bacterium]